MPECYSCKKALQGSWNMTTCGTLLDTTGRYLGISDGYFLYGGSPNWVYCYCYICWQKQILALSFVPNEQQLDTLQQQLTASQQSHTTLQQQLTASQQSHTTLQQQLFAMQTESTAYKKQLDEINEKYNKLSNTSGIEKLRDLLKQFTSLQIDALHTHTNFRIDTFETIHGEQQFQCSTQFVRSIVPQLKTGIDAVVQLQKKTLAQRKQVKQGVFQTLTTADVSKTIIEASLKPLEAEINQIETDIEAWNAFSTILFQIDEHVGYTVPISTCEKDTVPL